jgi:hypothetical protein
MAKLRVIKRQEKGYVELPPEMAACEEVEIFPLKEGYYLLSVPIGQPRSSAPKEKGQISEQERAVLRKLLSIRFENRTPAYVGKALSGSELEVLGELERRRLVNVFRGNKYKDGVYNINDSIYPLLSQRAEQAAPQAHSTPGPGSSFSSLGSRGFAIINDKREALALSDQLQSEIKSGSVVGIKGFDGKFYLVTKNYLTDAASAIASVLKDDMDVQAIASAARLEPDGCIAVLRLLAEGGEIIEKKKGIFAPV